MVGIAGTAEKCRLLTGQLGNDAAINYREDDLDARLGELMPEGADLGVPRRRGAALRAQELPAAVPGVRDSGLLQSALARPRNQFACGEQSLARLAVSYAFGISRSHPFLDGNKRSSLVVAELFLELNGLALVASDADCVTTFLALAAGELAEEELAAWIESNAKAT